jgi:hypothetical protein
MSSNLTIEQQNVVFVDYTWRVLDIQDNKILLLSEEILEYRAYHSKLLNVSWEDCDLRKYLNGSFLESFTQEEQDAIIEVANINNDNQWFGTEGGNATNDKIFLLSLEEVAAYFGGSGQLEDIPTDDPELIADQYNEDRIAKYGNNSVWWWLRSPGGSRHEPARVDFDGAILVRGDISVANAEGGVRPALWIQQ